MAIILHDLAAADDQVRFSPYCWRTKMALLHKGAAFETLPWRFTDSDVAAQRGSPRVPAIQDGETWISDSWEIALYLDETYPENPLMDGAQARGLSRFVNAWCDMSVNRALRPLALLDVLAILHEKDKAYFRESREAALGMTLEEACAGQDDARTALGQVLAPAEQALSRSDFLSGDAPCYADYCLFGSLKWVHALSGKVPLATDSAIARWFDAMLDLFDGFARKAPTGPC